MSSQAFGEHQSYVLLSLQILISDESNQARSQGGHGGKAPGKTFGSPIKTCHCLNTF